MPCPGAHTLTCAQAPPPATPPTTHASLGLSQESKCSGIQEDPAVGYQIGTHIDVQGDAVAGDGRRADHAVANLGLGAHRGEALTKPQGR